VLLGGLGLLLVAAVAALATAAPPAASSSSTRDALAAYQERVVPVVKDWGSIEVLGMRPAIADLRAGDELGAPAVVAAEARAWRAGLSKDRAALASARPPAELADAARLLDRAMAGYLRATDLFLAATGAVGSSRARLVEEGIRTVSAGARTYDEASRRLHDVLRAHGVQPSPVWGLA
jgi:hypothetical protein